MSESEEKPLTHRDIPAERALMFVDTSGQSHDSEKVGLLLEALEGLQNDFPDIIKTASVYTDLERKQLTTKLGVFGTQQELHSLAKQSNGMLLSHGVGLPFGNQWSIDH